ncbi:TetR/AcrR family transcriptional regulator [Porticoccus sp. W117]|uniref:TetR/AcrR family transcriptional regulator n=1 Tax=Porticoccus sp. W117 TaxID=3054777 RepID=UPI0025917426|nr:TetR/AcrR family transcriptional regulator [Porticoccus sp. W117]MDM3870834.1 TetR/AcrR family transcriptional regulator [Porticoccus sp. W117]
MARTREFDPAEVIEKAVLLFWEKGYTDTSMDDLVKYTGISRYGIYGEFGNKREFFIKALQHFHQKFALDLIQDLANPDAGLAELRAYYGRLIDHAKTTEARMGCFMCNTAVELASTDEGIGEQVDAMFEGLQLVFRNALGNGQVRGELPADMDLDEYASYLLGVQMAMAMMVRSGFGEQRMKPFLKVALAAINN